MSDKPKLIIGDDWKSEHQAQQVPKANVEAKAPAAPGLQVDSDWKNQAAAEKEKLAAQTASKPGAKKSAGGREMPPADFKSLLGTVVTQALLYMGAFPDPQTGRAIVSLEYAAFHIDLLSVLEEKTRGNLSEEEQTELTQVTHELRLRFVELQQAVAEMALERAKGGPAGAGIGPIKPGM
jgi:hypothetical protein